jgi:hypothetical protein
MDFQSYGEPVLKIGPLRIWVHGRQYPDATDGWDGNWLRVTAHCGADGASVAVSGAILDTVSFATFGQQLATLHQSLTGEARLESVEPNLSARIVARGGAGQLTLRVDMTSNPLDQGHWFAYEIDQSYLPGAIAACEAVIQRYPVRSPAERGA